MKGSFMKGSQMRYTFLIPVAAMILLGAKAATCQIPFAPSPPAGFQFANPTGFQFANGATASPFSAGGLSGGLSGGDLSAGGLSAGSESLNNPSTDGLRTDDLTPLLGIVGVFALLSVHWHGDSSSAGPAPVPETSSAASLAGLLALGTGTFLLSRRRKSATAGASDTGGVNVAG